jgi:hypothetical protein
MFGGPGAIAFGVELLGMAGVGVVESGLARGSHVLTRTVAGSAATRPFVNSRLLIQQILNTGKGVRDPGGIAGALRFDVLGRFGTSAGVYELVINPRTMVVYHFLFRTR